MFSVCASESRGGRHRCANWLAVAFTDDQDDAARAGTQKNSSFFVFGCLQTTPHTMSKQEIQFEQRRIEGIRSACMKRWEETYNEVVQHFKTQGKPPNKRDTDKDHAKLGHWLARNTKIFGSTDPEDSKASVNEPKYQELFLELKMDIERSTLKPIFGGPSLSVDTLRKRARAAADSDSPASHAVPRSHAKMDIEQSTLQPIPGGSSLSVDTPCKSARAVADSDSPASRPVPRGHAPIIDSYDEENHTEPHRDYKRRNNSTFVQKVTKQFPNLGFDQLCLVLDGPLGLTTKAILNRHPGARILIVNKCHATCEILRKTFSQPPFIDVEVTVKKDDLLDFLRNYKRTGAAVAAAYVDACTNNPDYVAQCVGLLPNAEVLAVTILTNRSKLGSSSTALMQQLERKMGAFERLWPDDAGDVGVFVGVYTSFWKRVAV